MSSVTPRVAGRWRMICMTRVYHRPVIPYYNLTGPGALSLGMPMSQNRMAVPTWSYAFELHPPARIIELGTAGGGFITALAVHAYNIGVRVVTYDLAPPDERFKPLGDFLRIEYRTGDMWKMTDEIATNIRLPGTTYVLCDGGNKPHELEAFAPFLKHGDVIAAHDYDAVHELDPAVPHNDRPWQWSEIRKSQGDRVADKNSLVPWLQTFFDHAGWLCYRR